MLAEVQPEAEVQAEVGAGAARAAGAAALSPGPRLTAEEQRGWLDALLARRAARVYLLSDAAVDRTYLVQKEHTYHRVVAAERLRRRLAAFACSPGAAQRAGVAGVAGAEGAEGAEGVVPMEAPVEASAFADTMRTGGGPGGGAAGATQLALRLLPACGDAAASVETQPQRCSR